MLDGQPLSVVMRTPGDDIELALGLMFAEGIARSLDDLRLMRISAESGEKVVGRMLLAGTIPMRDSILVVSGRACYEIVQKSITAGIPILAAVGAPSSLAVALSREFNQTLVGFLRGERFNVYASPHRLAH